MHDDIAAQVAVLLEHASGEMLNHQAWFDQEHAALRTIVVVAADRALSCDQAEKLIAARDRYHLSVSYQGWLTQTTTDLANGFTSAAAYSLSVATKRASRLGQLTHDPAWPRRSVTCSRLRAKLLSRID